MLVIFGRRKLRIKKYTDSQAFCPDCKSLGLKINVYKEYFHIFFIPFFPNGVKSTSISCTNCNRPIRFDSVQKQYENSTKTPIYLYSGLIVSFCLILLFININIKTQKEKKEFVENPQLGDVYLVRKDNNNSIEYYFLRISKINGDSVFALNSNLIYHRYTSKLNEEDFFVKDDELAFTKSELKKMLDNDEINAVERGYDDSDGFNRLN